jgi:hypothetical protein
MNLILRISEVLGNNFVKRRRGEREKGRMNNTLICKWLLLTEPG